MKRDDPAVLQPELDEDFLRRVDQIQSEAKRADPLRLSNLHLDLQFQAQFTRRGDFQ